MRQLSQVSVEVLTTSCGGGILSRCLPKASVVLLVGGTWPRCLSQVVCSHDRDQYPGGSRSQKGDNVLLLAMFSWITSSTMVRSVHTQNEAILMNVQISEILVAGCSS